MTEKDLFEKIMSEIKEFELKGFATGTRVLNIMTGKVLIVVGIDPGTQRLFCINEKKPLSVIDTDNIFACSWYELNDIKYLKPISEKAAQVEKRNTMTKEQQLQHFNDLTADMRRMIEEKGNDYADDDRLSNFRKTAAITGTTPEMVCLNLVAVKVNRIANLLNGRKPDNESIRDSVRDLANYAILLDMILSEGGEG